DAAHRLGLHPRRAAVPGDATGGVGEIHHRDTEGTGEEKRKEFLAQRRKGKSSFARLGVLCGETPYAPRRYGTGCTCTARSSTCRSVAPACLICSTAKASACSSGPGAAMITSPARAPRPSRTSAPGAGAALPAI